MLLENDYFRIVGVDRRGEGLAAVFRVALLPECDVYRGHFPGNPVSPGACNIEMIKECCSLLAEKPLWLRSVKRCRLTSVVTPSKCPELEVAVELLPGADGIAAVATVAAGGTVCVEFKGTLAETRLS